MIDRGKKVKERITEFDELTKRIREALKPMEKEAKLFIIESDYPKDMPPQYDGDVVVVPRDTLSVLKQVVAESVSISYGSRNNMRSALATTKYNRAMGLRITELLDVSNIPYEWDGDEHHCINVPIYGEENDT